MKVKDKDKPSDTPSPSPEKVLYDNRIKRKNVLALNEKVAAIREFERNPVYKRIGRMFHCSPDQIKRIVQQKETILKAWEQRTRRCQDAKTLEMKVVRVSMLGKAVYDWIRRMMYYKDFIITDGLIQKIALQFKSAMGLQNFFPHQDWCDKFRLTYNITKSDSKLLKIGYTQGYSVQIKDIMKDVLSECTPDIVGQNEDNDEQKDENQNETETHSNTAKRCNETAKKMNTKTTTTTSANQQLPAMRQMPQLQPIRQLYIQTNSMPGMPQKVLVATPITGQRSNTNNNAAPMTMTIIPLATIAKPPNIQTAQTPATTTSEKQIVPPPMIEIKQEIKDEPMDVQIKQEYISDEESDVANATDNQIAAPSTSSSSMPDSLNQTQGNKKSIGETKAGQESMDYDDNLTLSSLRKIIQTKGSTNGTTDTVKAAANATASTILPPRLGANTFVQIAATPTPVQSTSATAADATVTNLFPALPPLTKAPSNIINRTTHKRKQNGTNMPTLPAIKTCSEARKYLKLLEDFALYKENFRLIGLITRADEVLRELDGNDDVDID